MSLKDIIHRPLTQQSLQENPGLRVDPEEGWIERIESDRPVKYAKAYKPAPAPPAPAPEEYREKYHKKGKLHRTHKMLGYTTFSLGLIWPQAANK